MNTEGNEPNLVDLVRDLARKRANLVTAKDELAAFEKATPALVSLRQAVASWRDLVELGEFNLRRDAISEAVLTGDMRPHPAVEVKTWRRFEYDVALATRWVRTMAPAMMILDQQAFDRFLKGTKDLPECVRALEDLKASIKTDLTPWLV